MASPTPLPSETSIPSETPHVESSPIPEGMRLVPDVVGMPYSEARTTIYASGLTFLFYDFYDRDQPSGVIMFQEPPAGSVVPKDELVVLYRVFKAPLMWVGTTCRELVMTSTVGKLTFAVTLEQDERYEVRTDFAQGETVLYDYRMVRLDSFDNRQKDAMFFTPEWTGWYVLMIGPYEVPRTALDQSPEGVAAGCLWVIPPER